jgi:hypothetical protein
MNAHQEIAPHARECLLATSLLSFIHPNRG